MNENGGWRQDWIRLKNQPAARSTRLSLGNDESRGLVNQNRRFAWKQGTSRTRRSEVGNLH